jgi:hypothetical protein
MISNSLTTPALLSSLPRPLSTFLNSSSRETVTSLFFTLPGTWGWHRAHQREASHISRVRGSSWGRDLKMAFKIRSVLRSRVPRPESRLRSKALAKATATGRDRGERGEKRWRTGLEVRAYRPNMSQPLLFLQRTRAVSKRKVAVARCWWFEMS